MGKVVIRFWANWSTSRPGPLTSQSFHFGCMSDLCGLLPSSLKLLCLLGRLAMKHAEQSGVKSASVSGLQIPGGISSPHFRESAQLPNLTDSWEVSLLHLLSSPASPRGGPVARPGGSLPPVLLAASLPTPALPSAVARLAF